MAAKWRIKMRWERKKWEGSLRNYCIRWEMMVAVVISRNRWLWELTGVHLTDLAMDRMWTQVYHPGSGVSVEDMWYQFLCGTHDEWSSSVLAFLNIKYIWDIWVEMTRNWSLKLSNNTVQSLDRILVCSQIFSHLNL